jgi:hypothetical protein
MTFHGPSADRPDSKYGFAVTIERRHRRPAQDRLSTHISVRRARHPVEIAESVTPLIFWRKAAAGSAAPATPAAASAR